MEQIHERLKTELSDRGITAAAAARAAGMPDSQGLRDTLNGRKRVTADLLALLIPLGVDALYVLTGQRSQAMPVATGLSRRAAALLDNFEHTDEAGKKIIEGTATLAAQSKKAARGGQ